MRIDRRVGVIALLLVVSAAAIAVLSPDSSTQSSTTAAVQSNHENFTAGMRVYMDPETGEITSGPQPVAELDPEMANALRHDDTGLAVETHPNGAKSLDLDGRYADVVVVRIDENGKMIFCAGDPETVEKAINDTTTPTGPEVK